MVRSAAPLLERPATQLPSRRSLVLFRWLFVGQAVVAGLALRLWFVHRSDFPLNDGGLFYAMVEDLRAAHFRLPSMTSYNGSTIPFAYPPLGLYVAAALQRVGLPLEQLFRFLPTLVTCASIVAFARFSRTILRSWRASVAATMAFALLPMAFVWQIMGGGITRAFGQLFSLLALTAVYRLYTRGERRSAVTLGITAGLTVLSHPEAAWFIVYTIPLFWLVLDRSIRGLRWTICASLISLGLVSPWALLLIHRHGWIFLRPLQDSGWSPLSGIGRVLLLDVTREPIFPIFGALALLGFLVSLAQRRWLLPLWTVVIPLAQARAFDQRAVIPLALLAGIGFTEVLLPLLHRATTIQRPARFSSPAALEHLAQLVRERAQSRRPRRPPLWLFESALVLIVLQSAVSTARAYQPVLASLTPADRAAMAWVRTSTPADARFIVVTGESWFGQDRVAEWFPALTKRTNVGLVQGYEWVGQFSRRVRAATDLQACPSAGLTCLEQWSQAYGVTYDYVYLVRQPSWIAGRQVERFDALLTELLRSPGYTLVYSGPGAFIFRRVSPEATLASQTPVPVLP